MVDQLVLEIYNERPFRARDLSALFGALARDYRRFSGRELIIAELYSGSLITILRDAVEFVGAAKTVIDFGKSIADFIGTIRGKHPETETETEAVVSTVEKLLDTAVHSKAEVKLRYRAPTGEHLFFEIKPMESQKLAQAVKAAKRNKNKKLIANERLLVTDRASLLRAIRDTEGNVELLRTIARILVEQGMTKLLREIAAELKRLGREKEALILLESIHGARLRIEDLSKKK